VCFSANVQQQPTQPSATESTGVTDEPAVMPESVEEAGNQLETSVEESHRTAQSSGVADEQNEQAVQQIRVTAADLSPLPHADPACGSGKSKRKTKGTHCYSYWPVSAIL